MKLNLILLSLSFVYFAPLSFASNEFGRPNEKGGVYSLSSLEISLSDKALAPIVELGKSVSVLGMGEPIHGSHDVHVARTQAGQQDLTLPLNQTLYAHTPPLEF